MISKIWLCTIDSKICLNFYACLGCHVSLYFTVVELESETRNGIPMWFAMVGMQIKVDDVTLLLMLIRQIRFLVTNFFLNYSPFMLRPEGTDLTKAES